MGTADKKRTSERAAAGLPASDMRSVMKDMMAAGGKSGKSNAIGFALLQVDIMINLGVMLSMSLIIQQYLSTADRSSMAAANAFLTPFGPSSRYSAPWPLQRALLTPQANPGSLYRYDRST